MQRSASAPYGDALSSAVGDMIGMDLGKLEEIENDFFNNNTNSGDNKDMDMDMGDASQMSGGLRRAATVEAALGGGLKQAGDNFGSQSSVGPSNSFSLQRSDSVNGSGGLRNSRSQLRAGAAPYDLGNRRKSSQSRGSPPNLGATSPMNQEMEGAIRQGRDASPTDYQSNIDGSEGGSEFGLSSASNMIFDANDPVSLADHHAIDSMKQNFRNQMQSTGSTPILEDGGLAAHTHQPARRMHKSLSRESDRSLAATSMEQIAPDSRQQLANALRAARGFGSQSDLHLGADKDANKVGDAAGGQHQYFNPFSISVEASGRISNAQTQAADVLGVPMEMLIGRPLLEFVHAPDAITVTQVLQRVARQGGVHKMKFRMASRRLNNLLWVQIDVGVVNKMGQMNPAGTAATADGCYYKLDVMSTVQNNNGSQKPKQGLPNVFSSSVGSLPIEDNEVAEAMQSNNMQAMMEIVMRMRRENGELRSTVAAMASVMSDQQKAQVSAQLVAQKQQQQRAAVNRVPSLSMPQNPAGFGQNFNPQSPGSMLNRMNRMALSNPGTGQFTAGGMQSNNLPWSTGAGLSSQKGPARKSGGMKPNQDKACSECHTTQSPEWRRGPLGPKTMCNACGLRYAKKVKQIQMQQQKQQEAQQAQQQQQQQPQGQNATAASKPSLSQTPNASTAGGVSTGQADNDSGSSGVKSASNSIDDMHKEMQRENIDTDAYDFNNLIGQSEMLSA
eukprot:Clim_evm1s33 gene=Clim_evmTU1s33